MVGSAEGPGGFTSYEDMCACYNQLEEDIEKFNIEISHPDILRQGKALPLTLYQNRRRKYQTWQAEGGKRPKHPMRQMFEDIIGHVVMRKPTWIAGEFRGGLSQYYNDQGELSND